jgi:hypothetical protein
VISHHHKCIFVHVPKAAGQSIEHAFTDDLGLSWRGRRALQLGANSEPEAGPPALAHLTASEYVKLKYVPQQMFDEYFTFAVVRNPWARTVSMYRYLNIHVPFTYFVQELLPNELWDRRHYFVRAQTDFVCDENGGVILDRIVRFENLLPEFYEVCDRVGLPRRLPHVNDSAEREQHRYLRARGREALRALRAGRPRRALYAARPKDHFPRYTDYYNAATRRVVASLYESDIDTFGYTFE